MFKRSRFGLILIRKIESLVAAKCPGVDPHVQQEVVDEVLQRIIESVELANRPGFFHLVVDQVLETESFKQLTQRKQ